MKNIQIILNAVLSKDIFEYILVNKNFEVTNISTNIDKYLGDKPQIGDDILTFLPELVGSEKEVNEIFSKPNLNYSLESVYKNDYYINISIEHYDENTLLILLHNITDITRSKQQLLQYSNESILLNNTLEKNT